MAPLPYKDSLNVSNSLSTLILRTKVIKSVALSFSFSFSHSLLTHQKSSLTDV